MEKSLLLPFVHGIDSVAFSSALAFAQEAEMTLLLVSVIRLPEGSRKRGLRAEAIAQAYDFFEMMAYKAKRAGVPIKCMQLSTQRVAMSIHALAQEMASGGILLFVRDGTGVLLETYDIKQLLERSARPVYLFRLAPRKRRFARASVMCMRWLQYVLKSLFCF